VVVALGLDELLYVSRAKAKQRPQLDDRDFGKTPRGMIANPAV